MRTVTTQIGGMAAATEVMTPAGPTQAGALAPGDWISLHGGGGARVAIVDWTVAPAVILPADPRPLHLAADQPVRHAGADLPAAWLPDASAPEPALLVRLTLDAPGHLRAGAAALAPADQPPSVPSLLAAVDRLRAARP